jgi:uncharacterized protein
MRILAFVDTHGSDKYIADIINLSHNADIIICAGDITVFENNLEIYLHKLNSIGKPVLVVHGNHETSSAMQIASTGHPNIFLVHRAYHIIGDYVFFGYGGGGFASTDGSFELAANNFMKTIKDLEKRDGKSYKFILVTHQPPYGTRLDNIGYHVGSKSIAKFINEHQPALVVCGHIHECAGNEDKIKETYIINPGPKGKIVEI